MPHSTPHEKTRTRTHPLRKLQIRSQILQAVNAKRRSEYICSKKPEIHYLYRGVMPRQGHNICILALYRAPSGNFSEFLNRLVYP
jgi:hypothetical protein